jgi:TonB family protein
MKNIITSPYRKMKVFLILPVCAIVLYAFAMPEYKYSILEDNQGSYLPGNSLQSKEIKGTIVQQDGKPLQGASLVIRGTSTGTISDLKGFFKLNNVPEDASLAVSFVGFKSKILKPVFTSDMIIQMVRDTVKYGSVSTLQPPPPPVGIRSEDGKTPLVIIDGKEAVNGFEKVDPNSIDSIKVLKDESAIKKYGEKGKNGVIEVATYKNNSKDKKKIATDKEAFVAVERMPQFPGGKEAMSEWLLAKVKYPPEAVKKGITGEVLVEFLVSKDGKIIDVTVGRPVNPLLDAEAKRVIGSMPDWTPGMQGGKPVDVYIKVPVNFALK